MNDEILRLKTRDGQLIYTGVLPVAITCSTCGKLWEDVKPDATFDPCCETHHLLKVEGDNGVS